MMIATLLALTSTQRVILIVLAAILLLAILLLLFVWRPRHRRRQSEAAAALFAEDQMGDWARKRLSTWTVDERHAALRYYSNVGRQTRSGAIRYDLIPDNHHATIVALAAQETEGGSKETKWGEVAWLGRNIAKRRDDLSMKWAPTKSIARDPETTETAVPDTDATAAAAAAGLSSAGMSSAEFSSADDAQAPDLTFAEPAVEIAHADIDLDVDPDLDLGAET